MLLLPSVSDDTNLWIRCQCRVKQRADMSDLCHTTIHKQFRSRDVAAVLGSEKNHSLSDLISCTSLPSGPLLESIFKRCSPTSVEAYFSLHPCVSMTPGLIAFTRIRRSFKSVGHVRANERTAALWHYKYYSPIILYCRRPKQ